MSSEHVQPHRKKRRLDDMEPYSYSSPRVRRLSTTHRPRSSLDERIGLPLPSTPTQDTPSFPAIFMPSFGITEQTTASNANAPEAVSLPTYDHLQVVEKIDNATTVQDENENPPVMPQPSELEKTTGNPTSNTGEGEIQKSKQKRKKTANSPERLVRPVPKRLRSLSYPTPVPAQIFQSSYSHRPTVNSNSTWNDETLSISSSAVILQHKSHSPLSKAESAPISTMHDKTQEYEAKVDAMRNPNNKLSEPMLAAKESVLNDEPTLIDDQNNDEDEELKDSQDCFKQLSVSPGPSEGLNGPLQFVLGESIMSTLSDEQKKMITSKGFNRFDVSEPGTSMSIGRADFEGILAGGNERHRKLLDQLSLSHAVIHVSAIEGASDTNQVVVQVENTSSFGVLINSDSQVPRGERRAIDLNDIVTLAAVHGEGDDVLSLSLVLQQVESPSRPPFLSPMLVKPEVDNRSVSTVKTEVASSDQTILVSLPLRPGHPAPDSQTSALAGIPSSASLSQSGCDDMQMLNAVSVRKLSVNVLVADPFTSIGKGKKGESTGHKAEHQCYREAVEGLLSPFASTSTIDINSNGCATESALGNALTDGSDITVYAGDGDKCKIIAEDVNGLPKPLRKPELLQLVTQATSTSLPGKKVIIVFTTNALAANLLAEYALAHVIYINSSSSCRRRASAFLRAFIASVARGYSVERSYRLAESVALYDTLCDLRAEKNLCKLIGKTSESLGNVLGENEESMTPLGCAENVAAMDALLIPLLTPHFVAREKEMGKVISSLRADREQVVVLHGEGGIGKTSLATKVARYASDRKWYRNGVHYISLKQHVDDVRSGRKGGKKKKIGDAMEDESIAEEAMRRVFNEVGGLLWLASSYTQDPSKAEHSYSTLLVLDDCDEVTQSTLRQFTEQLTECDKELQLLLLSTTTPRFGLGPKPRSNVARQRVKGLSSRDAAELFLTLAQKFLPRERIQKVLTDDRLKTVAKLPALCSLKGNPRNICLLVHKWKDGSDLQLEAHASEVFQMIK